MTVFREYHGPWMIFTASLLVSALSVVSCASAPPPAETVLPVQGTNPANSTEQRPPGISDEIRSLVESGSPPALLRALDLIRSRDIAQTEFGRVMSAVAVTLMKKLYPEIAGELPAADPPQSHIYARILRDAERSAYTPAVAATSDFLEHVLPFLSLLSETRPERLSSALPDLKRAADFKVLSVLDPYFRGIVAERTGNFESALGEYSTAYSLSADCYPAAIALARIQSVLGRYEEAIRLLSDLISRYPDNMSIKRELARGYYRSRNWSRAEPAIAEILQRDTKDSAFLLMRAHALVELGQFLQAQPLLDVYASLDANNRLYQFLRARVQAEGYKNRDAALTYLRAILRVDPSDSESAVYAARLLIESPRPEDQAEGRQLLRQLLNAKDIPLGVYDLALRDAVRREAWADAKPYVETLLNGRRSSSDLLNASLVYRGLREYDQVLLFARELYEREPLNEDGIAAYIAALIATGNKTEAGRLIDARLASLPGGALKSRYFFLRGQLKTDEEMVLNDLRSSLFEDPRNLDALMAMLDIYHRRKDERRAVYYLKQALALSPENPTLKRYQVEYAAVLTTN